MKYILTLPILLMIFGTGCVLTPMGELITAPIDVEANIEFGPRVHIGTRSSVSIWLHPNYHVYDAYPIAQSHCSRWGMYARPRYDWEISSGEARYLDYNCVSHRPYLAYPHYRRNRHYGGRYNHRRRHYPKRVYTPKPLPRVEPRIKRGTFGRTSPRYGSGHKRSTVIERGKPWEHNRNKNRVVIPSKPKRGTVVERGKPWEHNRYKNSSKKQQTHPQRPLKRSTFGGLKPKISKEPLVKSKRFGSLKRKNGPSKRGTLSL